tara:strand:+ start:1485 stop:1661 length:177 start_codon:yes stop_codon:yes gene_type:complete
MSFKYREQFNTIFQTVAENTSGEGSMSDQYVQWLERKLERMESNSEPKSVKNPCSTGV